MTAALLVEGLRCGYGRSEVLHDVSLSVAPGEVVCLMGRNGAGKTTLLRALMGLLPNKGVVHLEGTDITNWVGHRVNSAGMVLVPQENSVFAGLTVAEHLVLALRGRDLERGLDAGCRLFPQLGERLDQPAQTLSGGERKMLGLAQALVVEPSVILMDEPTEGVAPIIVEELVPAIRTLTGTTAIVLVEQNLDTALALGSRAYVLEHGTVAVSGDIDELHESGVLEEKLAV